jgi:hypothetical protein
MAQTSWPYTAQATTDIEYSRLMRETQDNGVVGSIGDTSLLVSTVASTMKTQINQGMAWIRGYMYRNDSSPNLELTHTVGGASPRIDRVVLSLDTTAIAPADRIILKIKPGTPATTPSAPALTQSDTGVFEISLAAVTIPINATTLVAGNVADERTWVGGRVGSWTTTTRPSSPRRNRFGFNVTTNLWEYWNGTAWVGLGKGIAWADLTVPTTYNLLDGKKISMGTSAPSNASGNDGDFYAEY